ncbi:hypothetical protein [Phytoactinopolyspora limicola]|uniref:hypothetical protein n=1 Tax=Phytoactinopolyspora limicola TaxID=2715536 RepID=UPI0014078644|nr:hypothetical protein [Phytoactinopolyspora limicola]
MSNAWDEAGQALRNSRLYVHPDAEAELAAADIPFTSGDQNEARSHLDDAAVPIWVAILPVEAKAASRAPRDIANAVGQQGTYVVFLSNGEGDAVSTAINGVRQVAHGAADFGTNTLELIEHSVNQIERLAENQAGAGTGAGGATTRPRGGGGGMLPLAILVAAGGGGYLLYRRNRRNRERVELDQVRNALDEDITAYGERLSELDLDVQADSAVPIEARQEYGRALDLYENAKMYADRAEKAEDLKPVTNALEEGRWLLGCVQARMSGDSLPERRSPCFFDPGHGPSVEDVSWAPPGGVPRLVPACAADAMRVKQGLDPDVRLVRAGDGERRPYWEAGPAYGGWAAGYFGAVLPAMMVGTMLGSAMAAPMAYGAGAGGEGGGDFGGGFDDGGGDFGGGFDGGGGDFGGGFGGFEF